MDTTASKPGFVERALNRIEAIGNKLPDPAMLFLISLIVVWVLSWLMSGMSFADIDPRSGAPIVINNLLAGDAMATFLSQMVTIFTGFAPLGVVLVAMLGVGVADEAGYFNTSIKMTLSWTPKALMTPMVVLVGLVSHSAIDAGYVLVIPLGGIIFYAVGRHPIAGIAAAFAGVSGGFSANPLPGALDPLLQGFTQPAAQIIDPSVLVNPLGNYYFTAISSILIVALGWAITDWIIEPRLNRTTPSTLNTSQITTRNNGRRLVVDTTLETSRTPINELNSSLGLDGCNSRVNILWYNITSEHHATSHVLTVTRIALGQHVGWLEYRVGDLTHGQLLVVSLLSTDDRSIRGKHKVDTRIRYQVGLELGQIYVQCTIESQRSSQRRNNLTNQSVQVGVSRTLNIQVSSAYIVQSFVIQTESTVSVLQKGVRRQYVIVRLNYSGRYLRSRGNSERKLGFSSVVNRQTLQKKGTETGTRSTTGRVEDHETLKTGTVIS
jgi:hypothetical protein